MQKIVEVPQWQVDVPLGAGRQVVERTIEVADRVQGVQTCESLSNALVHHVAQA